MFNFNINQQFPQRAIVLGTTTPFDSKILLSGEKLLENRTEKTFDELLLNACKERNKELFLIALYSGAKVNFRNETGYSALHWASLYDYHEMMELLLENGADVNAQNRDNQTPLHISIDKRNLTSVSLLIKYGANVNAEDKYLITPLILSCLKKTDEIVKCLIETEGIQINLKDTFGRTALSCAFQTGNFEIAKLLIKKGASQTIKNIWGKTPINMAICRGHQLPKEFSLSSEDTKRNILDAIAHIFNLEGVFKEKKRTYRLQGSSPKIMFKLLAGNLKKFSSETQLISLSIEKQNIIQKALFNASFANRSPGKISNEIQNNKLCFIQGMWFNHALCLVFYKNYMAICNRGEGSEGHSTIEVFKIDPQLVTKEIIQEFAKINILDRARGINYFYKELPGKLSITKKPLQDNLCKTFATIAPKPQQSKNCTIASIIAAIRFAWVMLSDGHSFDLARRETKLFTAFIAILIGNDYDKISEKLFEETQKQFQINLAKKTNRYYSIKKTLANNNAKRSRYSSQDLDQIKKKRKKV